MIFNLDLNTDKAGGISDSTGAHLSYQELTEWIGRIKDLSLPRSVVFVLAGNNVESVTLFLALIEARMVPLLLNKDMDEELLAHYVEQYHPKYICRPALHASLSAEIRMIACMGSYVISECCYKIDHLYEDLTFLLSTSGSTGSPKLVRYSRSNFQVSVQSVAKIFELTANEKGFINLPVYYVQGLFAALAHLYVGASLVVSDLSLARKEFWELLKKSSSTFITGVPFSFEVMLRIGLLKMDLPNLRIINLGGGKISDALFKKLANWAEETNRKFIVTYGATETGSRMMYLPPALAVKKTGSIGYSVPQGRMELVSDQGEVITTPYTSGEMIYYSPKVFLGYAFNRQDLAKGDECHGRYSTGDIAYFDEDGCYYITGRKSRFTKIFGYRISLDETEKILKERFNVSLACIGDDKCIYIYVEQSVDAKEMIRFISDKLKLLPAIFQVVRIAEIPRNHAGKVLYGVLAESSRAK